MNNLIIGIIGTLTGSALTYLFTIYQSYITDKKAKERDDKETIFYFNKISIPYSMLIYDIF